MTSNIPDIQNILTGEELAVFKKLENKINLANTKAHYSLSEYTDAYRKHIKDSVSASYLDSIDLTIKYLKEILGEHSIVSNITTEDAENVIKELKKRAPKGFYVYYRNLRAVFNWGAGEYFNVNVFAKCKLPKQQINTVYITRDQLKNLVSKSVNELFKTIFQFAFYTGCRRGEIHNLRWNCIDFIEQTITIGDNDFQTKSRQQRVIPMSKTLYKILKAYSKSRKKAITKNSYVFTKSNGFRYCEDAASKYFKKMVQGLGLDENLTFHSLRHSFASHLVQSGVSLYKVQKLLGHSSIKVTERYAHLNVEALKEAVTAFD